MFLHNIRNYAVFYSFLQPSHLEQEPLQAWESLLQEPLSGHPMQRFPRFFCMIIYVTAPPIIRTTAQTAMTSLGIAYAPFALFATRLALFSLLFLIMSTIRMIANTPMSDQPRMGIQRDANAVLIAPVKSEPKKYTRNPTE